MGQPVTPDVFDSWNSLEGVSVAPPVAAHDDLRGGGEKGLEWVGERIPGFALAAALALLAQGAADWAGRALMGNRSNPINAVPIAIILGLVICNAVGVPALFTEGLKTCMRPLQRLAIVLLGWRLSLGAVGGYGLHALPVVVVSITAALIFIPWFGTSVGLSRRLATLIAVGTSICGVSAIMATAPAIDAKEGEVSYAVACVAIFGMLAMLAYPFLVPLLLGNDHVAIGIFFGSAIHDTAQVTGAALAYQQSHHAPDVLNIATVVKIMRNLSMAIVIPLMAGLFHRGGHGSAKGKQNSAPIVPLFVVGFLAMTVLRTVGDLSGRAFGVLDHGLWAQFLALMDHTSTWLLTLVMAAVGLSTGFASLKSLGMRPFFVGLSAAVVVGAVGWGMIQLLGIIH